MGGGMQSPAIQHLLRSWSKDARKVTYLNEWCRDLVEGNPVENPRSLRLDSLSAEVRAGMMHLVVPLLQQRKDITLKVSSQPVVRSSLRIEISPLGLELKNST